MHIVIVGGGKVGSHLAAHLATQETTVSLIEIDEDRCALIDDEMRDKGVVLICGDGDEPYVLDEADIRGASAVVAATGDDEDNLVVSLLAKNEYQVPMTIARINNPRNEWLFTEEFGVDMAVSSTTVMAGMLETCLADPECGLR